MILKMRDFLGDTCVYEKNMKTQVQWIISQLFHQLAMLRLMEYFHLCKNKSHVINLG